MNVSATTSGDSLTGAAVTTSSAAKLPEGWVAHPRIPITARAVWMGIAVAVFAVSVAFLSIYFRRTQLELTTRFWGPDTVRAMQLAPEVRLHFDDTPEAQIINLTGTPGLGHLRHALLEQKHYEWDTESALPVRDFATQEPLLAKLTFSDPRTDPTVKVPSATVWLELNEGWVGWEDGTKSVRLNDRVRPAVRHFLVTIRNVQQLRADYRQKQTE